MNLRSIHSSITTHRFSIPNFFNHRNRIHAIKQEDEPNKLFINEDGATYCIIEEIEVYELNEDDLQGVFTSDDEHGTIITEL